MSHMSKMRVGILGATGVVGQNYLKELASHSLFEVAFLAASQNSSGKSYREVLQQKGFAIDGFSEEQLCLPVYGIEEIEKAQESCQLVFSAVSTEVAKIYERLYAAAGLQVVSNTAAHRQDGDVPLLIPEVNPEHLEIISVQQKNRGWKKGFIVAKPNCSLQSYLLPLFPLHRVFGIKRLMVTTLQAVSGAGYPGVSSMDMIDNVIPYIPGEEEKSELEPLKILGRIESGLIQLAKGIVIAAHCNRVPVLDGHLACVSVEFERKPEAAEILALWQEFKGLPQTHELPSAPLQPIIYRDEPDRPQPRLDRNAGKGMSVTVGRLRSCPLFHMRFVALSHNTLRGAAKGGILNAEMIMRSFK